MSANYGDIPASIRGQGLPSQMDSILAAKGSRPPAPSYPIGGDYRLPAGAQIDGKAAGGQMAGSIGVRKATFVTPMGQATWISRIPSIIAGVSIRTAAASREQAEWTLMRAQQNLIDNESILTGALHDSLYIWHGDLTQDWLVSSDLEYAPYVEFGTHRGGEVHAPPKPYLLPAIEAGKSRFIGQQVAAIREGCL